MHSRYFLVTRPSLVTGTLVALPRVPHSQARAGKNLGTRQKVLQPRFRTRGCRDAKFRVFTCGIPRQSRQSQGTRET